MGCSPWGREESDTIEQLHFHFSFSCPGEGNGNPLQYSCLENPRDRSLVGCCLWGCTESDMTDVAVAYDIWYMSNDNMLPNKQQKDVCYAIEDFRI